MKNFSPYTDLALEAAEKLTFDPEGHADGVEVSKEDCELPDTVVTWVKVTNTNGAETIGKPIGNYITIESPYMKINDPDAHRRITELLSKYLLKLHKLDDNASVLVVGLGNRRVTPDALGPRVAGKILVTRHMRSSLPFLYEEEMRSVAAVSPGVMGITGIETLEIIKGITERVQPDLIIAIDALAARRANRINATIQMADTGVSPGAGVGNRRGTLNAETLGIPVIAIGVPTVVDAATLVNDTLDLILEEMKASDGLDNDLLKTLDSLSGEEKYDLICRILQPYTENMFVTPKEVDEIINMLVNIISQSLNTALHPTLTEQEISQLTM